MAGGLLNEMNIRIKATKITMNPAIENYLEARLRPLERLLGDKSETTRCEVEISRAGGNKQQSDYMWLAELHILVPGEKSVYAKNHAASVNAAIDDVKEEAERQIRRMKKAGRTARKKVGARVKTMLRE